MAPHEGMASAGRCNGPLSNGVQPLQVAKYAGPYFMDGSRQRIGDVGAFRFDKGWILTSQKWKDGAAFVVMSEVNTSVYVCYKQDGQPKCYHTVIRRPALSLRR